MSERIYYKGKLRSNGTIEEDKNLLSGTKLSLWLDKIYDRSNKNYNDPVKGAFARAVDGLRDTKEKVETIWDDTKTALGFLPVIGDAMDVASIILDLNKQNYSGAALTASLMLLPGSASKIKSGFKYAKTRRDVEQVFNTLSQNLKSTEWYSQLRRNYGDEYANAVVRNILHNPKEFLNFIFAKSDAPNFWPGDEIVKYAQAREIMKRAQDGGLPVAGSASVMNEGTISRPSAAFHDLDFYVKAPGYGDPTVGLEVLNDPQSLSQLPVFHDIFPELLYGQKGKNEVRAWTHFNPRLVVQNSTGLIQGTVLGFPIDLFPTFNKVLGTYGGIRGSGFVSSEVPMSFKRAWRRPKDVKDLRSFERWSYNNPVIDLRTGKTQFSPLSFEDGLLTTEGLPVISNVSLYPGSRYSVPAMMNWKGELRNPLSLYMGYPGFFYKDGGKINYLQLFK